MAPGLPTLPGLKTVLNLEGGGRKSHVVLVVENPPANARDNRDVGSIPGLGRSPGGGHGNPSSILAWRIPQTEEPNRLQFIQLQRIGHS